MTGEAGIVNDQCCGMHCYALCIGSWLDKVHWYRAMRHPQSFWKFAEISRKVSILIYLYRQAEYQTFFKILFPSNTDSHRLLGLYSLIECLQVNQMYVTSFWFHTKLVMKKAKKPASYELAIHYITFVIHKTVIHKTFIIHYIIFFKKDFWIFWSEHFDRLHSTNDQVLYINKGDYIWEHVIFSDLIFPDLIFWDLIILWALGSGFNFAFDLAFSHRNLVKVEECIRVSFLC